MNTQRGKCLTAANACTASQLAIHPSRGPLLHKGLHSLMKVMSIRHDSVPRLAMHPHRILGAAMLPARKDARPRRNNAVRAVAGNCRGVLERLFHHRPLQHVAVRWRIVSDGVEDAEL